MKTIIKVQRPIFPQNAPALIYNKKETIFQQMPLEGALKVAMGDSLKSYFEVAIAEGEIKLLRQVFNQGW